MQGLRVLLVGTRILPYRHAGDKNFWLDVIHGLRRRGHEVEVVTSILEDVRDGGFPIRRVEPIPMFLRADSRFNSAYNHLAGTNNYVSKTLSLPRIVRELRRTRREFRPDVMHFIDNYGPGMIGLRPSFRGCPMTISAPTYQPDRPLYDMFLRASFASFDAVAPLSDAYRRRLVELRIRPGRIRTIRWGVDVDRFTPPTAKGRTVAREALGLRQDEFVVFWTGFIQQTSGPDLALALETAKACLQNDGSNFTFLFCFKPEHFKDAYLAHERPGIRVFGTAEAYHSARIAADALLCPLHDVRATAAPPLAWLESLSMGIPIVTTAIPGAEEAVVNGQSGFSVRSSEAAARSLQEIQADDRLHRSLQEGARRIAVERYSVDRALDEYIDLWSTVASESGPTAIAMRREMRA